MGNLTGDLGMKLLYKHIAKDFLAKKTMMVILSLLLIFTSFLYFFVRFSVDKNLDVYGKMGRDALIENELKYLTALESNKVLIRNMTGAMILIFVFVLFLFISNIIKKNIVKIGQLQALGFMPGDYGRGCAFVLMALALPSTLIGFIAGFFASSILIKANMMTYYVNGLVKGIHPSTFIKGTVLLTLLVGAVTYLACVAYRRQDPALLIKGADISVGKPGIIERFIGVLRLRSGYRFKLTFRSLSEFLLLLAAIVTFNIMIVLSMSLLESSDKLMDSQMNGRSYRYETYYDDYQDVSAAEDSGMAVLKFPVVIKNSKHTIDYNIIGIDGGSSFFSLVDDQDSEIDITDKTGIILNPELAEDYKISIGDKLTIMIDDKLAQLRVTDIAENAELKSIYVSRQRLAGIMGINRSYCNCFYSDKFMKGGMSILREDVIKELSANQTSNKTSAVINQCIGIATGILLIFLAFFIGLSGNVSNILIFDLLGYDKKMIESVLLNPYVIVGNFIYVLTLPISVYAARKIQISTSFATGDYMPFILNGLTLIYMWVVVNAIFIVVREVFVRRIGKVIHGEKQAEFLCEW